MSSAGRAVFCQMLPVSPPLFFLWQRYRWLLEGSNVASPSLNKRRGSCRSHAQWDPCASHHRRAGGGCSAACSLPPC